MGTQINLNSTNVELLAKNLSDSIVASFSKASIDIDEARKLSLPDHLKKTQADSAKRDVTDTVRRMLSDYDYAKEVNLSWVDFCNEMCGFSDQISMEELRTLIPGAMSSVVQEAAEPEYIGTKLLETIRTEGVLAVNFPAFSAVADAEEVGNGQEYPIRKFAVQGQGYCRVGKFGLRVEIQDDVRRYVKGFDIMGRMLSAAGRAMARTKEKRIFAHLTSIGNDFINNLSSSYRNSSGVGIDGAQNGSITLDDLVEMAGDLINRGFNPDLILVNGLAWTIFARTPEIRDFALASAKGPLYKWPTGSASPHPSAKANPLGYGWEAATPLAALSTSPDSGLLGKSLQTVVTPYMPYVAAGSSTPALTNIIVADSRYLGAIMQDEDVTTEEFSDPRIDVISTKFRERYALATAAGGEGISVARNIAIKRGLDPFANFQFSVVASPTWPGPTVKTAISGLTV